VEGGELVGFHGGGWWGPRPGFILIVDRKDFSRKFSGKIFAGYFLLPGIIFKNNFENFFVRPENIFQNVSGKFFAGNFEKKNV